MKIFFCLERANKLVKANGQYLFMHRKRAQRGKVFATNKTNESTQEMGKRRERGSYRLQQDGDQRRMLSVLPQTMQNKIKIKDECTRKSNSRCRFRQSACQSHCLSDSLSLLSTVSLWQSLNSLATPNSQPILCVYVENNAAFCVFVCACKLVFVYKCFFSIMRSFIQWLPLPCILSGFATDFHAIYVCTYACMWGFYVQLGCSAQLSLSLSLSLCDQHNVTLLF